MLNKRDLEILEYINGNTVSLKSLSKKYNISERNARYYIENINACLRQRYINEIVIKKSNVILSTPKENIINFIESLNADIYIFSKEERKEYILYNFLFRENTKISEMEKELKVSRTTVKKDIKSIEKYLNNFELYFYRYENKISIAGKEKKLRHLKFLKMSDFIEIKNEKIVFTNTIYKNEKNIQKILLSYIKNRTTKNTTIKNIMKIIGDIEKKLKTDFTSEFKNIITIYLIVTLERIDAKYIITRKNNGNFLRELKEYEIIKKALSKTIDKNYEYEMLHLTEYFLSGYYDCSFSENIIAIEKFISKMLEDINVRANINLIEELMKYLIPSIYRIKNNFNLNKSVNLNEVNEEIFDKIKIAAKKNMRYLKEPLREEEIFNVSKIIEKYSSYGAKISLKTLLNVIEKNKKSYLAEKLKETFFDFIEDDREKTHKIECEISRLLNKNKIYISKKVLSLEKSLEIGEKILLKDKSLKKHSVYNMKNIVSKFGKYLFLDKKILLCFEKENSSKSSMSLVVSKKYIKISEKKEANILFLISPKYKREYLKIISELTKLTEKRSFLKELINQNKSEDIIEKIKILSK